MAAAKKAAAEAAERKRALANRGYLPGTTDPREIARQILKNKYGYGDSEFDCFNNIIIRESMWDIDATNPSSGRVRDPAGAARVQDGYRRQRLADQPGHPDHLGHRVHGGPLRQPLRRLELQARPRLVLAVGR